VRFEKQNGIVLPYDLSQIPNQLL